MLNAKALSELLSKNSDQRLCKRWYLMTPNGTLLAYTQPTDMKDLRKQVAVAALSWQDHQQAEIGGPNSDLASAASTQRQLYTLIIESETSNVLVRQIQPELLLVLEGGVPPRKRTFGPQTTAEGLDGELLHDRAAADSASVSSLAGSTMSSAPAGGVLGLHRKKLDAMAAAIASDFEQTGFKMPDESVNKFF
ncbi:hypothetical protein LTR36_006423 [Oleoguttula mirabilis]|uniref:PH domain-containing protein n=1 Tax=Oleoguttula mirabilis TaxID=1507867 RepID=A0AAV9JWL8_9PEZI|nr:hypothetical protein LTR36_006423 [Oleoguttula mirabilis]